jgi:hypothetical protein
MHLPGDLAMINRLPRGSGLIGGRLDALVADRPSGSAGLREAAQEVLDAADAWGNPNWSTDRQERALAHLRAVLSAEPHEPERFDRTWSHYADDCPTPPGLRDEATP